MSDRDLPTVIPADAIHLARRTRRAPAGSRPKTPPPASLTPREREVLALVAAGHPDKGIALVLSISPRTVSNHVASILRKLGAETRAGATRRAQRLGLLTSGSHECLVSENAREAQPQN